MHYIVCFLILCTTCLSLPAHATHLTNHGPHRLAFLGDSLTAGYQLAPQDAYPALLQHTIGTHNITIINSSVSGDTSYSILNRLEFFMETKKPNTVMLCIGSNDGLRGIPIHKTKQNITQIITTLQQNDIKVLLAGMQLPQNYGPAITKPFKAMYPRIATYTNIPILPFLLTDVAAVPSLNLTDRIHPNAKGHKMIAKHVHAFLVSHNVIETPHTHNTQK